MKKYFMLLVFALTLVFEAQANFSCLNNKGEELQIEYNSVAGKSFVVTATYKFNQEKVVFTGKFDGNSYQAFDTTYELIDENGLPARLSVVVPYHHTCPRCSTASIAAVYYAKLTVNNSPLSFTCNFIN
ncbi:MAG: hypothetical protein ACOYL6_12215 [Bacteriovoracaceae bacterium]